MKKRQPLIRVGLVFMLLLGSLTMVVWRQSVALDMQRALEAVRAERVLEESRRSSLSRRVEQLESRSRVSEAAGKRLGMRLPTGDEIVILPLGDPAPPAVAGGVAAAAPAADGG